MFTTRLAAEGGETRITNRGRFIPGRWIPPLIGTAVLETETRKQFAEFRAEILRRKVVSVRRGDSSAPYDRLLLAEVHHSRPAASDLADV